MGEIPVPVANHEAQFNAAFDVMADAVKADFPNAVDLVISIVVDHGSYEIKRRLLC